MKNDLERIEENSPEKRIARSYAARLSSIWNELGYIKDEEARKAKFIQILNHRIKRLSVGNAELEKEYERIIDESIASPVTHEWVASVSAKLSREITKHYSLEELEQKFYQLSLEDGNLPLNKMFTYRLSPDSPDTITLHVPIIFPSTPMEINNLAIDAMKKLKNKLRTDSSLSKISLIRASSEHIFRHPQILNRFGFELIETDAETKRSTVEVPVAKFLELDF